LLESLQEKYPLVPNLIVDEGEELVIDPTGAGGNPIVEYEEHEGSDRPKKTDPGGSESKLRLFVSHGGFDDLVPANAPFVVQANLSLNAAGIHKFPFEENAPANNTFELLGFATKLNTGSGVDISYDGLRLWKNNEPLLAEDEAYLFPDHFPYNAESVIMPLHLLFNSIMFVPNDKLTFEFRGANAHQTDPERAYMMVTFFFIERIGGAA
jgi:hypothetical protein